ncbi:MAG: gamma-glutamyltransferase [Candidatus Lambdaproteobacteria bacterium RIFOXYD1_FULL_56_27]|uniref:Glutathione hydrolase proenzyme n=1 Tax=Candidatus Lambdaproteobacteria bacterium RIFOXYD2_FULL_56_26 TaxID=1817773 RepID=A0A1F6GMW0_9PROT|nr:MAG: gamma-glutamyltransferase [Candidatus Lambdaproteobacteria bacterium RIFOXYD2_FULL_56_26]OGH05543.1 MAG: gamma-glutamyltransferase [Candidatus Lambdaproteobacteria bacterium RIFOXYC1_FULL_56_13]OGH08502.1 MAG: gamma-glutamyltransferase [Candidatus Lambdaproteobacteria bacterium RIFOXYD1_FULL_56_27]
MKFVSLLLALLWSGLGFAQELSPPTVQPLGPASVAKGKKMMVVGAEPLAVKEAFLVLEKGGNAVDAAVVMGFVMAVTYPKAGNLGGGGFMLMALSKDRTFALDYRERAPLAATTDMFLDETGAVDDQKIRFSHLSSGVPGTVAGLLLALHKFGTISTAEALAPAIRLAAEGFVVTQDFVDSVDEQAEHLKAWPSTKQIFFKADGSPYKVGERFVQKDLAQTLKKIATEGRKGFYQGEVAKRIADQMALNRGLITEVDLQAYQPALRKPLIGQYRGYEVLSMPPPSSGGVHVIQLLNLYERYNFAQMGQNRPQTVHLLAEAMKRVYADRAFYMGDADFVKVPVDKLISKRLADQEARGINLKSPTSAEKIAPIRIPGHYGENTTHFSIVDGSGMAVSNTYTLNFSFGSGIVVEGTGVLLNNEMDDFSAKPGSPNAYGLIGGVANSIAPKKRMLSSMSPTIVRKDQKPILVTGSPGGSKIITTVVEVIQNVLDHKMGLEQAVTAPRIHHQWLPDQLEVEPSFDPKTAQTLRDKGYQVEVRGYWGRADSIAFEGGQWVGVSDPRGKGLALGK